MKAAQISDYGGPEVITVKDTGQPVAAEGQVLVAVAAAGVNPFDVKVRDGINKLPESVSLPATLGGDVSGTVAEIGPGVSGFERGQAVYGQAGAMSGQGSFAEFTPVKAQQLAAAPKSIDLTDAAALPLAGTSAYQAIADHINLQPGQKILIQGGAGGIGSIAVQIAKHIGAYVASTARADDVDFVKQLGADEVIDYESQDFTQVVKGYDAAFDTVGGETNSKSYEVLKRGGTLVSMVMPPDEDKVSQLGIIYIAQQSRSTAERLTKLAELVESGAVKANIDKIFPLAQAAEALEYLKTGHPRGKVVIKVSG